MVEEAELNTASDFIPFLQEFSESVLLDAAEIRYNNVMKQKMKNLELNLFEKIIVSSFQQLETGALQMKKISTLMNSKGLTDVW